MPIEHESWFYYERSLNVDRDECAVLFTMEFGIRNISHVLFNPKLF